nr:hypothetical protein OG461_05855 [Streptomyces sp. NBC_00995]
MSPYVTQHYLVQGGPFAGPMSLPEGTQQNALALAAALTDPHAAGIAPETCHMVSSQQGGDILQRLSQEVSAGDGLLVYWTGRSRVDRTGKLQLALALQPDASVSWLAVQDLVEAMKEIDSPDRLLGRFLRISDQPVV